MSDRWVWRVWRNTQFLQKDAIQNSTHRVVKYSKPSHREIHHHRTQKQDDDDTTAPTRGNKQVGSAGRMIKDYLLSQDSPTDQILKTALSCNHRIYANDAQTSLFVCWHLNSHVGCCYTPDDWHATEPKYTGRICDAADNMTTFEALSILNKHSTRDDAFWRRSTSTIYDMLGEATVSSRTIFNRIIVHTDLLRQRMGFCGRWWLRRSGMHVALSLKKEGISPPNICPHATIRMYYGKHRQWHIDKTLFEPAGGSVSAEKVVYCNMNVYIASISDAQV